MKKFDYSVFDTDENLVIPEYIDGYRVTSIGDSAFSDCEQLTTVTIPDSVKHIGRDVFLYCDNLKEIKVGKNNPFYTSIDGVLYTKDRNVLIAYPPAKEDESFTIPDEVEHINFGAFNHCSHLRNITLTEHVASANDWEFSLIDSLLCVTIPDNVEHIGKNLFSKFNFRTLEEIRVGGKNRLYKSIDGILYTKDRKTLVAYPHNKQDETFTLPNEVRQIDSMAFENCQHLKRVTIPIGVFSIGAGAFQNCKQLNSVTIPNSVTSIENEVFSGCSSLQHVEIPDSITAIGNGAFWGCKRLDSITIPNSVKHIGRDVFLYCDNLKEIKVGEKNPIYTSIDGILYTKDQKTLIAYPPAKQGKSFIIPDSVKYIEKDIFSKCYNLEEIIVEDKNPFYTSIDGILYTKDRKTLVAYPSAKKEKTFSIPDGVEEITSLSSHLTNIVIPDSVTSVEGSELFYCDNLTAITISDSAKHIDESIFFYFNNLEEIRVGEKNLFYTSIGGILYTKDRKTLVAYPRNKQDISFKIPDGVQQIADSAFMDCNCLTNIFIPDSVSFIGDSAFFGCEQLNSITIPESVTSIGDYAFQNCEQLTSIIIQNSVISIGDGAFSECISLTDIVIPDNVKHIGERAFVCCDNLKEIKVGEKNPFYISIDGVLYTKDRNVLIAYPPAKEDESFTIPDGVQQIADSAFTNCDYLTNIFIPDSVTSIGDGAFWGCSGLTNIIIPDNVKQIDEGAFGYCYNLEEIKVGEKNPSYVSIDGVLYTKDMSTLVAYLPTKKEKVFTIPDGVKRIASSAFISCCYLRKIIVPDSVTSKGIGAFWDCEQLFEITIPKNIVDDSEFLNCFNLRKRRYY